jgi:hypothetical protein
VHSLTLCPSVFDGRFFFQVDELDQIAKDVTYVNCRFETYSIPDSDYYIGDGHDCLFDLGLVR